MTDAERIARLEARQEGQDKWLQDIDDKLDQLIAAANMGKGAWWLFLKLGGLIVVVSTAFAWLWEHWPKR